MPSHPFYTNDRGRSGALGIRTSTPDGFPPQNEALLFVGPFDIWGEGERDAAVGFRGWVVLRKTDGLFVCVCLQT